MLQKTTRGLKWFAGFLLVLLALQTVLLANIYQELVNVRAGMDVLQDTVTNIARNQP